MYFIWYIIIGILAGFIASKIMRGGGYGIFINLLIGIVGGVLGGLVFSLLGIATAGILGSLITSVVGAILLLWIVSLFRAPHKTEI
ncbi:GlsB/YeaQ/YmgE family stress response membrane protein [Parabacteroides sp. ZJ-118]|uniref:GlsB/YeaQ/YmgE family stress response membrane protein n=1 Tax=Parabacteroides sp. ZJ-118 TaxID=2709398 RepID=UPI0013EAC7F0|nr:GlsB/YeaQ/YmgE family stress response membrane protein [Parabacteroides sp. ZJ-118]